MLCSASEGQWCCFLFYQEEPMVRSHSAGDQQWCQNGPITPVQSSFLHLISLRCLVKAVCRLYQAGLHMPITGNTEAGESLNHKPSEEPSLGERECRSQERTTTGAFAGMYWDDGPMSDFPVGPLLSLKPLCLALSAASL